MSCADAVIKKLSKTLELPLIFPRLYHMWPVLKVIRALANGGRRECAELQRRYSYGLQFVSLRPWRHRRSRGLFLRLQSPAILRTTIPLGRRTQISPSTVIEKMSFT